MQKQKNTHRAKLLRTVIRTVVIVLIAGALGINIYALNAQRLAGDPVPMPMGVGATVVLSGSMEPELSTGDLLFIKSADSYSVGDVVVFCNGKTAVVHRIIEMGDEGIITQGDANNIPDDPIQLSQIKGIVVASIPFVGYLINVIKTPIGTVILLGVAIWLLEASFKKDKKKDDDKLQDIREEIERLKQMNSTNNQN